uniref:Uncharacterized protein n=1 Tax=Trepomonas sp. PC1 TaxID=1076344 RepID=A0A146JY83_9EUKA|eukprot:JAP89700.1 Hypothetical protein TPC1_30805 [Trepomonas sp. PC1]
MKIISQSMIMLKAKTLKQNPMRYSNNTIYIEGTHHELHIDNDLQLFSQSISAQLLNISSESKQRESVQFLFVKSSQQKDLVNQPGPQILPSFQIDRLSYKQGDKVFYQDFLELYQFPAAIYQVDQLQIAKHNYYLVLTCDKFVGGYYGVKKDDLTATVFLVALQNQQEDLQPQIHSLQDSQNAEMPQKAPQSDALTLAKQKIAGMLDQKEIVREIAEKEEIAREWDDLNKQRQKEIERENAKKLRPKPKQVLFDLFVEKCKKEADPKLLEQIRLMYELHM